MIYPKIKLKKGKERSALHFHPWIFSGAIDVQDKSLEEGDVAEVFAADKTYVGTGHFHKGTITIRVFCFQQQEINESFWQHKFDAAHKLRKRIAVANESTTAYRLINAEGDGMPGLVVDIYGNTAVMQTHTIGMFRLREVFSKILSQQFKAVYDKSSDSMAKQMNLVTTNEYLLKQQSDSNTNLVSENGYRFKVEWETGQKTGFFLDQRDNRLLLKQYARNRKVLNTFCYTGGFSVYALGGDAEVVHSVDSSRKAMELTQENITLNFNTDKHTGYTQDVFDFIKQQQMVYDLIVLDPPAFAKHLSAVKNAMVGYRNLNTEAIRRIAPGGILFTFSCSQAIDRELFRKIMFQAAAQAKRGVKILHQLTQPADHPVSIYHPEGEYLKGLVLYVE